MLNALLTEGCTVVVPAFSSAYAVGAPLHLRPRRNGSDYESWDRRQAVGEWSDTDAVYTTSLAIINKTMGAIPTAVLSRPERVRGEHPLCSFAALGPLAPQIIAGQAPRNVFAPLRALAAQDGYVVLMGVGLETLTLLHLAEQEAGRRPFLRWAHDADGRPMGVDMGGCSLGFGSFARLLAPATRERLVGESRWLVLRAALTLDIAAQAIRDRPSITHCGRPDCERCRDAVLGGPIYDAAAAP